MTPLELLSMGIPFDKGALLGYLVTAHLFAVNATGEDGLAFHRAIEPQHILTGQECAKLRSGRISSAKVKTGQTSASMEKAFP
jgi:hypothetical protein